MEQETVKILRAIGISAGVLLLIALVAIGFYAYSKVLETKLTKLNIMQAKKDLGIADKKLTERLHLDSIYQNNHGK